MRDYGIMRWSQSMSALHKADVEAGTPPLSTEFLPIRADPEIAALGDSSDNSLREQEAVALRDDLAAIAAKTGERIVIPARPFTIDEWQTIRMLRSILGTASVKRTWTDLVFNMTPVQAQQIVDDHGDGYLTLAAEQAYGPTIELFGASLPLGWYRFQAAQARLANLAEVRNRLTSTPHSQAAIRLHFVPGPNATMEIHYPDWGLTTYSSERDAAERIVLLDPDEGQRLSQLLRLQAYRTLSESEQKELDRLAAKHRDRLVTRGISLYAERNALEFDEARRQAEAQLAEARARWAEFEAEPALREAVIEQARGHRAPSDG